MGEWFMKAIEAENSRIRDETLYLIAERLMHKAKSICILGRHNDVVPLVDGETGKYIGDMCIDCGVILKP